MLGTSGMTVNHWILGFITKGRRGNSNFRPTSPHRTSRCPREPSAFRTLSAHDQVPLRALPTPPQGPLGEKGSVPPFIRVT